ncbi:hypothetical protein A9B99_03140 [Mangrovibacter phragmitis]|uniref:DUF1090 domain-containing protein n=1 Tax=Mangrovibacter phragmitis TaxID=1691903 RepID=A0A1B7L8N3_9ENTR|nr:DUF1090 domain-containing protein [Mangrovibacter phragmitis]OAT78719.1 hypothetical protein A9B99_03140 [Mangrovibacter phragmitis]
MSNKTTRWVTAIMLAVPVLAASGLAQAATSQLTGCAAKQHEIEQQLTHAREQGNAGRVSGLKEALQNVQDHCTDDGLLKSRQVKVQEKEREVKERTHELKEAQASGQKDKIEKRQRKLAQAQAELAEARAELTK